MTNIIVVPRPNAWPTPPSGIEIVASRAYLREERWTDSKAQHKVLNLCPCPYQSLGYYVSLLAEARGHRVLPTLAQTQDIKSRGYLQTIDDEVEDLRDKALESRTEQKVAVTSYFGRSDNPAFERLAKKLFALLQIPVFRAHFAKGKEGWALRRIEPFASTELPDAEKETILELAAKHFARRSASRGPKAYRYDLAILHAPDAVDVPSNERALDRFEQAAEALDVYVERIEKDEIRRLAEFDALFIRETTAVNHHTYRFARKAQAEGLVVIDDPDSIVRCTNKVFLAELLQRNGVRHPATRIAAKDEAEELAKTLKYPAVLKKPDGYFSQGSYKVSSPEEFMAAAKELFAQSELMIAQEFVPTEYDWRIGILDGEPLFACRYYMAKKHWQIIKRDSKGREVEGDHETVPVELVPERVVRMALKAANLIGRGLYGVDMKEVDGDALVIEINDNPNIDAGVEDQILRDELYRRIMRYFVDRIEQSKAKRVRP